MAELSIVAKEWPDWFRKFQGLSPDGRYKFQDKVKSVYMTDCPVGLASYVTVLDKQRNNTRNKCVPTAKYHARCLPDTVKTSKDSSESEASMSAAKDRSHSPKSRQKSSKGQRLPPKKNANTENNDNKRLKSANVVNKRARRTPKATEISTSLSLSQINTSEKIVDQPSPEEKFVSILAQNLKEYSRQRLRAVQMSLRQYSNVEARVTQKDLNQAFQDNHVKVSNRVYQHLMDKFEDQHGVDFEKLYRYLTDAHMKSGRDSVKAMQRRNDLETQADQSQEERDNDLLKRLEELLIKEQTYFDIKALRKSFQMKDKDKTGKVEKNEVIDVCYVLQVPLYGALLKSLIHRCDDEHNDVISWPEFISFLEKSQQNAQAKCPELCEIPEKIQAKAPVIPNPIDELSEETKSKLKNKLLKKSSTKKSDKSISSATSADKNNLGIPNGNLLSPGDEMRHGMDDDQENPDASAEKDADKTGKETTVGQRRLAPNLKKVSNLVKTSSGFLNSVKSFISGKRKAEADSKEALPEPDPSAPEIDKLQSLPNNASSKDLEVPKPVEVVDPDENNPNILSVRVKGKLEKFPKPAGYDTEEVKLDPPQERLKLDWVYGYRGNDCRSNIHILSSDEIIYFISNIAVLYNRESHKQRHYREHTEDIKCLVVHSNGNIVASGQMYNKHRPQNQVHIRIWRADTLQTVHTLGLGMFEKAVMCLAFAKEKDILAAIDNSVEKKLTIWDTSSGTLVGETTICTEVICDVTFNPKYPDIITTIGKEHLAWWKIYTESGTIQALAQPDYENYLKAKFIICQTHSDRGDLITGDSNGTIYVWADGGNKITNFIKHAHDGPVFTIYCLKQYILSGGRDGAIYCWQWSKNMDKSGEIQIPKSEGGIRMLQGFQNTLLVGTTMNSLLSMSLSSKSGSPFQDVALDAVPITQGHFDDLRGLATVNSADVVGNIMTAGTDGIICWFDTERKDPVCKLVLKGISFLCVDSASSGNIFVLGTKDGHLVILAIEGESSTEVLNQKICKDKINCVKFSPDCKYIAAGSHDKSIYIYKQQEKEDGATSWEFLGKCKGHDCSVHSLDWSSEKMDDTYCLRSCSTSASQIIWKVSTLERLADSNFNTQSISWSSHHCKMDVSLLGLWSSKHAKDGDVFCVNVCPNGQGLVAMGDGNGYVSLFRFPCMRRGAYSHTYRGHATVHNLVFSPDGKYLISIGGRDCSIIQWKIV